MTGPCATWREESWRAASDRARALALGILPLGTGNDLARSLRIPDDWKEAVELLRVGGKLRRLDVLRLLVDGEPDLAANAVIVGNGARPGADLDPEEKARWGSLSYLHKAVDLALELEALEVELSVDGSTPRVLEALNVMIANGGTGGAASPSGSAAPRSTG